MSSLSDINNTLSDIQSSTARARAALASANKGNSDLGQDAFLMLLMTQLQNQDPMNPMDNKEFIAQQAQFTQVSELQKMNTSLGASNSLMQASSLIGKEVTLIDPENVKNEIKGTVTEAKFNGKEAGIVVNGKAYPISLLKTIKEVAATTPDTTESTT